MSFQLGYVAIMTEVAATCRDGHGSVRFVHGKLVLGQVFN
jgi:hypothetical protein